MEPKDPASRNYAHWMSSMHELCRSNLEATRERMRRYHDCSKKDAPHYAVGDLVMLNGKNIRTRRVAKKLDAKLFRPFKATKLVDKSGMLDEFELPMRWRAHNVFHTSLSEPYRKSAKELHPLLVAITERKVDKDVLASQEARRASSASQALSTRLDTMWVVSESVKGSSMWTKSWDPSTTPRRRRRCCI